MTAAAEAIEQQIALERKMGEHHEDFVYFSEKVASELSFSAYGTGAPMQSAIVSAMRTALRTADTFYWSPDLAEMLASVAPTLPETWTLESDQLPSNNGFAYFARPIPIPRPSADDMLDHPSRIWPKELAALLWIELPVVEIPNRVMMIVSFISNDVTTMMPSSVGFWSIGSPLSAVQEESRKHLGGGYEAVIAGLDMRTFGTAMAFMQQRILVSSPEHLDRASNRRIARIRPNIAPLVRVIKLRRAAPHEDDDSRNGSKEWSCQWMVRRHWRRQWYRSIGKHQDILVDAYVKGPEDKPLKQPRATVFAVVR